MPRFALIFDMDGVLLPSEEYNFQSYNEYFKPYGFSFEEQDKHFFLGRTVAQMLDVIGERHNISFDKHDFSEKTAEIQVSLMRKDALQPEPALCRFLQKAEREGVPLAVGTSSTRRRAEMLLSFLRLEHFFSALVTAEDVENHKPEPDVFLKAASLLAVPPGRCVVIEDAPAGIIAAKSAGMAAVGYTLFHKKDPSGLEHADLCLPSFEHFSPQEAGKLLTY